MISQISRPTELQLSRHLSFFIRLVVAVAFSLLNLSRRSLQYLEIPANRTLGYMQALQRRPDLAESIVAGPDDYRRKERKKYSTYLAEACTQTQKSSSQILL